MELAIADGNVTVIGEISPVCGDFCCEYRANTKAFLRDLVEFLGANPEKNTAESYKEAIAESAASQVVWISNAQRLPLSLRFWLADIDLRLILQCPHHPKKDIFLDAIAVEVPRLSSGEILEILESEAASLGLRLSSRRLQQLAINCASPSAARVMVRREKLGLEHDFKNLPGEYLDISPLILAGLAGFGVLRFVGLGTGDRTLYIIGGCAMMIGLCFKYLARFGSNRK